VWGNTLAWLGSAGCATLWVSDLAGKPPAVVAEMGFSGGGLLINETHAFRTGISGGLQKVPLSGGTVATVAPTDEFSIGMGGGWIYFSYQFPNVNDSSVIRRIRPSGGAVEDVAVEQYQASVLHVDESHVYFIEHADGSSAVFCIKRKAH
jgi:hypothetical protein